MFTRNEGVLDRIVRVAVGTMLLPAGLFLVGGLHSNGLGLVIAGLGTLALLTGLTGVCPLYIPFGISTLDKEKEMVARFRSMAANCQANGQPGIGGMCGFTSQTVAKTEYETG